MLPGAVTVDAFERNKERYAGRTVVAYCTIGLRSGLRAREWMAQGFDVRNLAGGVLAWAHADLPFVSDGRSIRMVHVYSPSWNMLPEGYAPVVHSAF